MQARTASGTFNSSYLYLIIIPVRPYLYAKGPFHFLALEGIIPRLGSSQKCAPRPMVEQTSHPPRSNALAAKPNNVEIPSSRIGQLNERCSESAGDFEWNSQEGEEWPRRLCGSKDASPTTGLNLTCRHMAMPSPAIHHDETCMHLVG